MFTNDDIKARFITTHKKSKTMRHCYNKISLLLPVPKDGKFFKLMEKLSNHEINRNEMKQMNKTNQRLLGNFYELYDINDFSKYFIN